MDRAASVRYQFWFNPFAHTLIARCDDPDHDCICTPAGDTDAYTRKHQPEINFCPPYFTRPRLREALKAPVDTEWEYIDAYYNTATCWTHELMHIREIGHPLTPGAGGIIDQPIFDNYPGIVPPGQKGYGAKYTKWLAQNPSGIIEDAADNADNYAMFFLANYIQREKGFYPHRNILAIRASSAVGADEGEVSSENEIEIRRSC